MKILVPIKRVPDPYARVRLNQDGEIDADSFSWVINPFDEIALEEAVRIRENGIDAEILAVSVGEADCVEQLRTALAMGADAALLILHEDLPDPQVISHILAEAVRLEQPDLILMGKQAIDDDYNQVGQRLAALLNLPQATFASQIELDTDNRTATVVREVDAGRETLQLTMPAVITTDLRLNEPRYVALPAILKARSKPLRQMDSSELGVLPESTIQVIKLEMPPPRSAGRKVDSVEKLAEAIRKAIGRD